MISEISQGITPFSGVFPQRSSYDSGDDYALEVETWLTEEQAFQTQLISVRSQMNTTISEMNSAVSEVNTNVQTTLDAKDAALGGANYRGDWQASTTYTQPSSVSSVVDGLVYVLKVASSSNEEPSTTSTSWQLLSKPLPLELELETVALSSAIYSDNELTQELYATGNKIEHSYTDTNLTESRYYDVDGTTLLFTCSFNYDSLNNLTSTLRSVI